MIQHSIRTKKEKSDLQPKGGMLLSRFPCFVAKIVQPGGRQSFSELGNVKTRESQAAQ